MSKGFTIIELVISVFILSIAVVGIFSAFSVMNVLTSDTTDRLTATYLAQEGLEIVRNIRDTNWLSMDDWGCVSSIIDDDTPCPVLWSDGLTESPDCSNGCKADYKTSMSPFASVDKLYLNDEGFYDHDISGAPTKFKREIIIKLLEDANGGLDHIMKVVVRVSWDKKSTILNLPLLSNPDTCDPQNCISAEATLYNWYNYVNH